MNRLDRLERKLKRQTKRPGDATLFLCLEDGSWFLYTGHGKVEYETEDEARSAADEIAADYCGNVNLIYDDCNQ